MSADNSIARAGREPSAPLEATGLEIPPELQSRYEVRLVDTAGDEPRIGLFRPGDRHDPAIEITANRIVALREDAETVDSLVRIAQHNGWERIDVEGSLEFRKAVWLAASREGLAVNGYDASFAEREQVEAARRDLPARGKPEADQTERSPASSPEAPSLAIALPTAGRSEPITDLPAGKRPELSDEDSRLLLRISALSEDRRLLLETLEGEMPRLAREVQVERVGENREALATALDRALESPSLAQSFERSGYTAGDLRDLAGRDDWDGGVADAIYLVRTGLHRDVTQRARSEGPPASERADTDRRERQRPDEPVPSAADHGEGGAALAELFLRGSPERVAAEPRLASAARAQSAMEEHISEVFSGDVVRIASAAEESRQMISDVLRRGLDVSVREPTLVRQIEPMPARADLER